jgi:hypothetical protein
MAIYAGKARRGASDRRETSMDKRDYVTFEEAAKDPSVLPYGKADKQADKVGIGLLQAADGSVSSWDIVKKEDGYVIEVALVQGEDDGKGGHGDGKAPVSDRHARMRKEQPGQACCPGDRDALCGYRRDRGPEYRRNGERLLRTVR